MLLGAPLVIAAEAAVCACPAAGDSVSWRSNAPMCETVSSLPADETAVVAL